MEPLRLQLELQPGEGPISGRILDGDGAASEFFGWLQLSTVLEHARLAPSPAATGSGKPGQAP